MLDISIAEGIASSLHKLDAEALRTALKLDADAKEVEPQAFYDFLAAKQGEVIKQRQDQGYQRGQSESLTRLEKDLRKEFGVDDGDEKGLDLIRRIVESKSDSKKSKFTDDDVKKHPLYLELEKKSLKQADDIKKEYETKLTEITTKQEYDKLLSELDQDALKIFNEIGPAVLPDDESVKSNIIKKLLLDELKSGVKYQKQENGLLIVKEDGTRLEDKAGNAVTFKDYVTSIAKQNFQFKKAEPRDPNNPKPPGQDPAEKKYKGAAPKTAQEYIGLLANESLTPEMKSEIKATYGANFQ